MGARCNYFRSEHWRERKRRFLDRVPVSALLENHPEIDDWRAVRGEIADAHELETHYAVDPLSLAEVFEVAGELLPSTAYDDWWSVWEWELADFPYPSSCPHPQHADRRCVYHLPPSHEEKPTELEEYLAASDRETLPARLTAARFGSLDLQYRVLDAPNNRPLDLRHATLHGEFDIRDAIIDRDLAMVGTTTQGVALSGARFNGAVDCRYLSARSSVDAEGATFAGELLFRGAEFEAGADFDDAAFERVSDFRQASFETTASFWKARFEDRTRFERATFRTSKTTFRRAVFRGWRANFTRAVFDGSADFLRCRSDGELYFQRAEIDGTIDLSSCHIGSDLDLQHATVSGRVALQNSRIEGTATFSNCEFGESVHCNETKFEDGLQCKFTSAAGPIIFDEASISHGAIIQPDGEPTYYEFENAVVGDVRIDTGVAAKGTEAELDRYRFLNTTFEGFEFSRHTGALADDWRIHTYAPMSDQRSWDGVVARVREALRRWGLYTLPDEEIDDLVTTYLKAKNGAEAVGESKAGSEFFLREMRYRRLQYRTKLRSGSVLSRARATSAWITNWVYDLTIGYGERPGRTLWFSLGIILLFSFFYRALMGGESFVSYLVLSTQIFVAFLLGSVPTVESTLLQAGAAIEAFLGAFFVALFVFALTRSVHR